MPLLVERPDDPSTVSRASAYDRSVLADVPPIRFADSDGARLAYQQFGSGPVDIVAIPPTAQHIEMAWERPEIRAMFDRFASFSRYLHFDKRGTGASERTSRMPGLDERVDDLAAVMDAAGVDRAHFFAASEGGPMAIAFAASHPERVQSLTFAGSYAARVRDLTGSEIEERRRRIDAFVSQWGTPQSPVVDGFAPSLAHDPTFRSWHQKYERSAATPGSLRELLELSGEMDVRDLLDDLDVPTLVLHRADDRIVPIELGRELADRIPGARLFLQEGADHFFYLGDVDGWMDEMERFVTGTVTERLPSRPSGRVRIEVLGRFAVIRDGEEVPIAEWGSRHARQICKRLVAARGWPVTRDELIDQCWPDETDMSRLGARLSVQLSAIRRVLGGGIVSDRSVVRLDLQRVETDLEAFWTARDDAAIVAAFPGPFLPEDVYEDWTTGARQEVRMRFVTSARRLAEHHASGGRHRLVLDVGRRLLTVDPFDVAAHDLVVDSLEAIGEDREAARARGARDAAMAELDS